MSSNPSHSSNYYNNSNNEEDFEYIFGFGSIMNSSTHTPWLETSNRAAASSSTTTTNNVTKSLAGRVARLHPDFGYERQWNFRSTTGFTALGVIRTTTATTPKSNGSTMVMMMMNGVLFRVPSWMMPGFDRREVGYDKVRIPLEYIEFCDYHDNNNNNNNNNQHAVSHTGRNGTNNNNNNNSNNKTIEQIQKTTPAFEVTASDKIWIYVPQASQCRHADENHPLLQSYVDTVLQGCLEWGGEPMAEDFVLTTEGWSPYFLNDTPSSRRPWLFRKDYDIIDAILQKHSTKTHYADRRHPEEFASTFLLRRMRGTWSLPRRNRNFTGRDAELGQIHARLFQQQQQQQQQYGNDHRSVNYLFLNGMGGVGKSSTCIEYCYRHFPSSYGLVIWLNAESAEALVADYRQLLADLAEGVTVSTAAATSTTIGNKGNDNPANSTGHHHNSAANNSTEEVIGEVKTRLFRCQVPWLLVFDNLEDRTLLDKFVPRGSASGSKGHVLVTSRVVEMELAGNGHSSLVLGCLSPNESLEMLRRALVLPDADANNNSSSSSSSNNSNNINNNNDSKNQAAAEEICERLGHLPLALGMAAAYMQNCDVSCVEYVDRYVRSEQTGRSLLRHQAGRLQDYSLTVSASLSLSLKAIEKESQTASDLLRLLCWLGPDQITKALLRALIFAKNKADEERRVQEQLRLSKQSSWGLFSSGNTASVYGMSGLVIASTTLMPFTNSSRVRYAAGIVATLSLAASMARLLVAWDEKSKLSTPPTTRRNSSNRLGVDEFEQSDLVWNILKSFSILTVKEGRGSIHRLLSQSLRMAHAEEESCQNLSICIESMTRLWHFNPKQAETWEGALHVLEHVKSIVFHVAQHDRDICPSVAFKAGMLSKEVGVFSAMALNGFLEAQSSLELSLHIFGKVSCKEQPEQSILLAQAEALHELGRVLRYQGNFTASEESLLAALSIRNRFAEKDATMNQFVADTLHELGVLEVKKHSLDTAESYLTKALDLRRTFYEQCGEIDADCAATLHQLAAVHVARKPPLLGKAEELLQEALKLSRQIGQRAATLKQLARVTKRQGLLDTAEVYLRRALELYIELYGERTMHINVAAVKFQQGALSFQRLQLEQAWVHFSECLRIRRGVYAYAKPVEAQDEDKKVQDPLHIEVSCVLHELGCVAFSQGRFPQALGMLQAERSILEKLGESSSTQVDRLLQARLTNLTWLRKCAKEMGDEEAAAQFSSERAQLKSKAKADANENANREHASTRALQREAIRCRLTARQFALSKSQNNAQIRKEAFERLSALLQEINRSPPGSMRDAARAFHEHVIGCLNGSSDCMPRSAILEACDTLRDTLRAHGAQVNDTVTTIT